MGETIPREKPCYITADGRSKGSFFRERNENRNLTSVEIECLEDCQIQPHDDIQIVGRATLDDFDDDLLANAIRIRRDLHPRLFANLSDEEILLGMNAIARGEDGQLHPTLAGIVAWGTYPQKFYPRLAIRCSTCSGHGTSWNEETAVLRSKKILGPAPTLVDETIRFLSNASTETSWDIAIKAERVVREALCNAIMHRDYSERAQAMCITVNLHEGCLEIISPGGLYGLATTASLDSLNVSFTRNQYLADIMEVTTYIDGGHMIENRGAGFMLMKQQMAAAKAQPPIAFDLITHFKLILHRSDSKASNRIGKLGNPIVDVLRTCGSASAADLEKELGLSRRALNYRLNKLLDQGMIERVGATHSPYQQYRLL